MINMKHISTYKPHQTNGYEKPGRSEILEERKQTWSKHALRLWCKEKVHTSAIKFYCWDHRTLVVLCKIKYSNSLDKSSATSGLPPRWFQYQCDGDKRFKEESTFKLHFWVCFDKDYEILILFHKYDKFLKTSFKSNY